MATGEHTFDCTTYKLKNLRHPFSLYCVIILCISKMFDTSHIVVLLIFSLIVET